MGRTKRGTEGTVRVTVRMPGETAERAKYWASRDADELGEAVSLNDFIALAVENEIARRAGELIDVDNILAARIGQLADAQAALATSVDAMSTVVTTSYASIVRLARGDSVLADVDESEDGELEGLGDDDI